LEKFEDPHVIYHMPGGQNRLGHEAYKQNILNLRPASSNLKMEMRYLASDGDDDIQ